MLAGRCRLDAYAPAHALCPRESAWGAQPTLDLRIHRSWRTSTTDRGHRAPPRSLRFLNVAPCTPTHWSGPRGVAARPESSLRQRATARSVAPYFPTSIEFPIPFSLRPIRRDAVVPIAGQRWAIEQRFEESKHEVGLDEYEVRTYDAWYRFMTLTLHAHAFLAAMRARQKPRKRGLRQGRHASPQACRRFATSSRTLSFTKCPSIRRTSSPSPRGDVPNKSALAVDTTAPVGDEPQLSC